MAHEITVNNGVAEAYYAEKPAWHRLGTVVEEAKTSKDALKLANLDWKVLQFPLKAVKETKDDTFVLDVPGKFANVREDNSYVLGVVGNNYEILQNSSAFDFLDSLVSQEDLVYESAGSLKGGKIVWMLARMKQEYFVSDDDNLLSYMLLVNGHDGNQTAVIQPTNVRVVCWNTLRAAISNVRQTTYSIRHTKSIQNKLEDARMALGFAQKCFIDTSDILKDLSKKEVNDKEVDQFLRTMFPVRTYDEGKNKNRIHNINKKIEQVRNKVKYNFREHKYQQTKAAKDSAFGLLNAYTQWSDHDMEPLRKTGESIDTYRFKHSLFGDGLTNKNKALKTVRELVGV